MVSINKKSKKPTIYRITSVCGEHIPFRTKKDLIKWCEKEALLWSTFFGVFSKYVNSNNKIMGNEGRRIYSELMKEIPKYQVEPYETLIETILLSNNSIEGVERAVSNFNASPSYVSTSEKGKKIIELSHDRIGVSVLLFSILHPNICVETMHITTGNYANAASTKAVSADLNYARIEAYLIESQFFSETKTKNDILDKIIFDSRSKRHMAEELYTDQVDLTNKIKDSLSKLAAEKTQEIAEFTENQNNLLKEEKLKYENTLKSLTETYKTEYGVREAIEYWKTEQQQFTINATLWAVALLALMLASVNHFSLLFSFVLEVLDTLPDYAKSHYVVMFTVSFPVFLVVWVLRICARNLNCNLRYMNEARHRLVLTKTFLALMAGGQAEGPDRILILNALYQPLEKHSDDGMPPNWYTLIMERMSKDVGKV
ncbi:MAG: hypothetical protein JKY93_01060 [Gammaproteobacteria bacterium]|nr:hypothetical protein [Gammaproteobacteria bacterium]